MMFPGKFNFNGIVAHIQHDDSRRIPHWSNNVEVPPTSNQAGIDIKREGSSPSKQAVLGGC